MVISLVPPLVPCSLVLLLRCLFWVFAALVWLVFGSVSW